MNGTNGKTFGSGRLVVAGALTLIVAGALSCTDNGTTTAGVDYTYDTPYLYSTYYPVDTAYSGYYWADSWNYYAFYYEGAVADGLANVYGTGGSLGTAGATGTGGTAGATSSSGSGGSGGNAATVRSTIASVVEALARGENICAGQVTITPKTATPACAGSNSTQERNGVTLVFNNCVVSGATINGTFDVISNRSASEQTCSATTTITLGHTTTITNLSVSDANGKIVIPSQTDMGMTTYTFGQTPTTMTFNTTGEMQIFNASNTMLADLSYTGMDTLTFSGNSSYSVDGTSTIQEKNGPATATVTKKGLTRSSGCCRPTGGSVVIDRSGGPHPGTATWTFGPSCGSVMRNNVSATLPACI